MYLFNVHLPHYPVSSRMSGAKAFFFFFLPLGVSSPPSGLLWVCNEHLLKERMAEYSQEEPRNGDGDPRVFC